MRTEEGGYRGKGARREAQGLGVERCRIGQEQEGHLIVRWSTGCALER